MTENETVGWHHQLNGHGFGWTPGVGDGLQHALSITSSHSLLKLMSIESVMPYNHLMLCRPFILPSIFPSTRVFSSDSALPIR